MRFLCVSAPLPGHLDWGGYLATARHLGQSGHEVLWSSGEPVAPLLKQADISFLPLPETGWRWPPPPPLPADSSRSDNDQQHQKQVRALDQWLDVDRVSAAYVALRTVVDEIQPDVLLTEMFIAAAGLVAEATELPLIVVGWPAPLRNGSASGEMVLLARDRLRMLLDIFGLAGRNWTSAGAPALCSPDLHLTYWCERWFENMAIGAQTEHAGGLAPVNIPTPDPTLPPPDQLPWVLITLGTTFNQDPNFFVTAAHAASQLGCLPLLAVGAPLTAPWVQKMAPKLPSSAIIRPTVAFRQIMPYLAAAIHHGGAGTTHALATHAVPQVIVPHAGDQMRQAYGVARTQAGIYLPAREATVERCVNALATILPDRSNYRMAAAKLQSELQACGGIPAAAQHIVHASGGA